MTAAWPMVCPACRAALGYLPVARGAARVACAVCGAEFARRGGVWDFLTADQATYFAPFLAEYTTVRMSEGRGDLATYDVSDLPWAGPANPRAWEWYIRAASFGHLVAHVVPPAGPRSRPLRVLDLGAGTGWLSRRLAELGHAPLAVDVSDDPRDGLGAARVFDGLLADPFPRVRADFGRLPLADGAADVAIYNASFHYSPDLGATLAEGVRVVAPGGRLIILDSPIYRTVASGERMVAMRRQSYVEQFGFASDRLGSREFLVDSEVGRFGRELGLRWRVLTPHYGLAWHARRWWRRWRTGRESARFEILVAQREADA